MILLDREQIAELVAEQVAEAILGRLVSIKKPEQEPANALVIIDGPGFCRKEGIVELVGEIYGKVGISEIIYTGDDRGCEEIKRRYDLPVSRVDTCDSKVLQLVESCDHLFVLNLTVSNASKICNLYDDGLVPGAVQYALLTGKDVFVGDICSTFGAGNINRQYFSKLEKLAETIAGLGIKRISDGLGQKPEKLKDGFRAGDDEAPCGSKKVLCLEDIRKSGSGEIRISKGTIITPLAMEYIRDRKISVITI